MDINSISPHTTKLLALGDKTWYADAGWSDTYAALGCSWALGPSSSSSPDVDADAGVEGLYFLELLVSILVGATSSSPLGTGPLAKLAHICLRKASKGGQYVALRQMPNRHMPSMTVFFTHRKVMGVPTSRAFFSFDNIIRLIRLVFQPVKDPIRSCTSPGITSAALGWRRVAIDATEDLEACWPPYA